jgi:hypothetical protein
MEDRGWRSKGVVKQALGTRKALPSIWVCSNDVELLIIPWNLHTEEEEEEEEAAAAAEEEDNDEEAEEEEDDGEEERDPRSHRSMQPELGCRDFEFGVENSVVGATTAEFTPLLTIWML